MQNLKFIQACPLQPYFIWQTDVQLTNFRKWGYSEKATVLVFVSEKQSTQPVPDSWRQLQKKYPETKFYYFRDVDGECTSMIDIIDYNPLLRPWMLAKYFTLFPDLSNDVIFYHDADIVFSKPLDFEKYMNDDICYLSHTGSRHKGGNYLNLDYLKRKETQVLDEYKEGFPEFDVIGQMAELAGITREIVEENDHTTGGAQYILKNIDSSFWEKVYNTCIDMKPFLGSINQTYFPGKNANEKEAKGYQSFCTDMWAVLYNLWGTGHKTEVPKELDFAWATDPISFLDNVSIMHNAGATGPLMDLSGKKEFIFYKGRYKDSSPYNKLMEVKRTSNLICSRFYADCVLEVKDPVY